MSANQQSFQYNHTAEDIPLGKVSTFDDEQKTYYHQQQEVYQNNNRDSINSIYQVKQSKFSLFAQPLLSVIVSAFFSIALLLLFLYADGKPLDHTLVGMKIPALVSLLLSINAIFLASGISKAIAEYKWVKLQNGAPLTMIDIYDACTRGLSGFFMTLRALQFDIILIVALIFHIGLLVVSPVSQSILVPTQRTTNTTGSDVRLYRIPSEDVGGRSKLGITGQAGRLNGLLNRYITTQSFTLAAEGLNSAATFICPNNAVSCVFSNISFITTTMNCQNTTSDDTALVYHNNTNHVIVLKEYLTLGNISGGTTVGVFPKFFYSANMENRTSYELDKYKIPNFPGTNIPKPFSNKTVYEPEHRQYVGEQSFVMAYVTLLPYKQTANDYTDLSFRRCSFKSSLNVSDWKTQNGTLVKTGVETSTPINLDYDNVLGNNIALNKAGEDSSIGIMVNAYLMQQTILKELVRRESYSMGDYLYAYFNRLSRESKIGKYKSSDDLFEPFMKEALASFDYAAFQTVLIADGATGSMQKPHQGFAFFNVTEYKVEKASAFILCLCLLLPIVWWIIIWMYSLKKNNGVSRANSQIVLLATNMTPDAQRNLQGFAGLDSSNAFKRAKDIRIRLGVVQQQTVVGLDHENHIRPFA